MFTDGNFHDFLILFKVLQAKSTLLLIDHELLSLFIRIILEFDAFHNSKVDSNDSLSLWIDIVVVELAVFTSTLG